MARTKYVAARCQCRTTLWRGKPYAVWEEIWTSVCVWATRRTGTMNQRHDLHLTEKWSIAATGDVSKTGRKIGRKEYFLNSQFHLNIQRESRKSYKNKEAFRRLHRSRCSDALWKSDLNNIYHIHSEVTHPLLRLLLIGSTFKPLGQRQDEERERIFVRPPLPGHESRGTTGVTTPDNQRGILNFHKVKAGKKSDSPVWRKTPTPSL